MMRAHRNLGGGGWLLVLLVVVGCASPVQPDRVPKDKPFDLHIGESALTTDDVRIRFDTVRSDSRCPADVQCVRAGEAVIAVTLSRPGEAGVGRELETTPARSSTAFLNFTITLTSLQPYPRTDRQTRTEDYVGTFVVTLR